MQNRPSSAQFLQFHHPDQDMSRKAAPGTHARRVIEYYIDFLPPRLQDRGFAGVAGHRRDGDKGE